MTEEVNGSDKMIDRDWENRVLCSDESCIGVIGPDGRCKECGKAYEGELPVGDQSAPVEDNAAAASATEPTPPEEAAPAEAATESDADEWEKRTLCSDESCIGVIGPDGRCKECGKPYEG